MNLTKFCTRRTCLRLELCCALAAAMSLPALAQQAPVYRVDASWPKLPLPNEWTFGGVTGLTVDSEGRHLGCQSSRCGRNGKLRDVRSAPGKLLRALGIHHGVRHGGELAPRLE